MRTTGGGGALRNYWEPPGHQTARTEVPSTLSGWGRHWICLGWAGETKLTSCPAAGPRRSAGSPRGGTGGEPAGEQLHSPPGTRWPACPCCQAPAPPSCSAPSPSQTGRPSGWGHCGGNGAERGAQRPRSGGPGRGWKVSPGLRSPHRVRAGTEAPLHQEGEGGLSKSPSSEIITAHKPTA